MKLKELLKVLRHDTVVCVVDDMGPYNDPAPLGEIGIPTLIHELERKVECVYFDPEDNSITIELEDYKYEEGDDKN